MRRRKFYRGRSRSNIRPNSRSNIKPKIEFTLEKLCESPIERILLRAMQDYGLIPACQYVLGPYRVDFAFLEDRLIVEADGAEFHTSRRAIWKDKKRDMYLRKLGWRVLRFTGSQIFTDAYWCARHIRMHLKK